MNMNELNQKRVFKEYWDPQGRNKKSLISARDQRGEISKEGLFGLRAPSEGSERVELTAREHTVAGKRWAVINGASSEVDPEVAVRAGVETAEAFGEGEGGVTGGVGVCVGTGWRIELEQVDVVGGGGGCGDGDLKIITDKVVGDGNGDGGEGGAVEGGRGRVDVGADGGGETGGEGRVGAGFKVEGVGDGEVVRGGTNGLERGGGDEEGGKEGGGDGGEGADEVEDDGDGEVEGEGGEGRGGE